MKQNEQDSTRDRTALTSARTAFPAPSGVEISTLLQDGIVCTDLDGVVTYWNQGATDLYGWTAEEMLGASLFARFPTDVAERVQQIHESVCAGTEEIFDWEDTRKDGRRVWVEARLSRFDDADGRPAGILGISRDVSARKLAEATVRRDALILSQLQDAVVSLDNELRVLYWNDAAERIFQWRREELIGRSILLRLPPETHPFVKEVLDTIRGGASDLESAWEDFRKDGSRVWVRWRSQRLLNERGEVLGLVSVGTDVTEQRQAETRRAELERQLFHAQRMETMGTLAGGIAHDFNNILAAIMMQTELALENPATTSPLEESLKEIRRSSLRAKALVNRILTFSRPDDAARVPLDLRAVVREVANFMRATLPASLLVKTELPEAGPPALGDANQLHQVLVNLASNAAFAMPLGGEIEFRVGTRTASEPMRLSTNTIPAGRYVTVSVVDGGTGMDATTLQQIFEPFYTTKPPGEGTGLGLAIVRTILQNHGGGIQVESAPGRGSVFTVYVPAATRVADRSVTPAGRAALLPGRGERILLVDDEESVAVLTRTALESLGFHATYSTSPEDFLRIFQAGPGDYDLILTDQTMQRTTGVELGALLRREGHQHPIIVATGNRGRVDPATLERLGRAVVLDKPFEIARLGAVVREMLDARGLPREGA